MNRSHPLEHRIPPPLVTLVIAVAMGGLTSVTPSVAGGGTARGVVGVTLVVAGFAAAAAGFFSFRRLATTIDPVHIDGASRLVSGGLYRISRNPMYLGMALMLLGVGVLLSNPASLVGPVAFVAFITRFQIVPEERALLTKFGSDYARYQATTRRWI